MAGDFKVLPHTADIGIAAYGRDMAEAFSNAARGMFSLMLEASIIEEKERRSVELEASDPEGLLAAWLNELIYLFDAENIVFNRFDIMEIEDTRLKAVCYGEKINLTRHRPVMGIKAATHHMLEIEQRSGVRVQVLFDI
jgi:SHS2 domain-containing protein